MLNVLRLPTPADWLRELVLGLLPLDAHGIREF